MTGKASTVGDGYAVDIINGRAAGPGARSTYVALLSAAPGDATTPATMTEITITGYARQLVTWSVPTGQPALSSNSGALTFGPLTGASGAVTVGWCALVSASSGTTGDFLFYWTLNASRTPNANDSIQFAVGALQMSNA